jgi:SAM-dependent methyltransferase
MGDDVSETTDPLRGAWRETRRWLIRRRERRMDRSLGIQTVSPRYLERPDRNERNGRYEPLPYGGLRTISAQLKLGPDDIAYDLGCGKGRIVCWCARQGVAKCVGVEFDGDLAEEARRNASLLVGRHAPIEIRTADAAVADYADATVVTLYNPFGSEVLHLVLENLSRSLETSPRRLRIVYASPRHEDVFADFPKFPEVARISIPYDQGSMAVVFFEAR